MDVEVSSAVTTTSCEKSADEGGETEDDGVAEGGVRAGGTEAETCKDGQGGDEPVAEGEDIHGRFLSEEKHHGKVTAS